jgi:hypothetical protein
MASGFKYLVLWYIALSFSLSSSSTKRTGPLSISLFGSLLPVSTLCILLLPCYIWQYWIRRTTENNLNIDTGSYIYEQKAINDKTHNHPRRTRLIHPTNQLHKQQWLRHTSTSSPSSSDQSKPYSPPQHSSSTQPPTPPPSLVRLRIPHHTFRH